VPHPGWAAFSFDGIGTRWEISTPGVLDDGQRRRLLAVVEDYDAAWSRFRPDSLVAQAARRPGSYHMPDGAGALGRLYRSLYRLSEGAMTPLIGGSLEQLGYDPDYSLRSRGTPLPAPRWDDVLDWQDDVLTTTAAVVLDVGAASRTVSATPWFRIGPSIRQRDRFWPTCRGPSATVVSVRIYGFRPVLQRTRAAAHDRQGD
jgi:thiamine biosynthesis lipoprotein